MTVDDEEDGIMGKIVVPADDKPVHEKLKRRTLVVVEIINVWYLTYIYFLGGNLRMHHIHSQFNNSVHS
jgi:hypothetical protein